jgi:hypothetical protein
MTKQPPAIDFACLSYPSDRITIQAIRARNPRGFSQEDPSFFQKAPWESAPISEGFCSWSG